AIIVAINAYICRNLFALEFSQRMESIEGSYMSIARWAAANWSDLTWFPLWFNGMPFEKVYQPGFHFTVAGLSTLLGWTPQHAYHFLTAVTYSAGALTLFWLCYAANHDRVQALTAALAYSLISPTCFLVPLIRADAGGWLAPRRYQILVHYGEGPHISAVALIPVVILVLHGAVTARNRACIALAPFALAAVPLTNWPGSMGLTMAVAAYCLAQIGAFRALQWLALIGSGVTAYLIASPWLPPSVIAAVIRNAQQSDGTSYGAAQIWPALILAAACATLLLIFKWVDANRWLRFFAFFMLLTGGASIGREWFGWRLLPQPNRFQVEFEMAFAATLAYLLIWCARKLPARTQVVAALLLVGFAARQVVHYARYAQRLSQPIDITSTIEYQMAKWFEANLGNQRVFAPGNVSLWMNMFTNVPQVAGCCDQGIPNQEYRIAVYTIYTGQNAGARDAEISLLWLRAYGANAIGTTGPNSTEFFKPYWNWKKFDGVLPELWRQGENVVYRVPRKSIDPVRVIPKAAVMPRAPENGLVIEHLQPFVNALEDQAMPAATFHWVNRHEAEVDTATGAGQVIFLQISHDAGWKAIEDGIVLPVNVDPLGMSYVEPVRRGPVHLRLVYDGGSEVQLTRIFLVAGLLMVAALVFTRPLYRKTA
ncbi:MAG: hypothetical protein ACRD4E_04880, partial [Bryobacteraceae bacterium]